MKKANKRSSGILIHITSLPSKYGVGDFGPDAFNFADFLAKSSQTNWQILPVNPPAILNPHSPYSCLSTFAGNPVMISPQILHRQGFLERADIQNIPAFDDTKVNFAKVIPFKRKLLNIAYRNFLAKAADSRYDRFCEDNKQWLDDYALFVTMRDLYKTGDWYNWPKELRDRTPESLISFAASHKKTIRKHKFLQYVFFRQYSFLKLYCNKLGIRIIGDIPIYVSYQSSDVWTNQQFFKLNRAKKPAFVSGTPPDCFCNTGQLWGNPVYDWVALKKDGYSWWLDRIGHNLKMFDTVRIDHFRALVAYWQVPASHKTAAKGKWIRAPKDDFYRNLLKRFPNCPIIVEDLGNITPSVHNFIKKHNLPGMRILQFGLPPHSNNIHSPANHIKTAVSYTGTHDNNTMIGWLQNEIDPTRQKAIMAYLAKRTPADKIHWQFVRLAMQSSANLAIISMQDILGLPQDARMNLPGTTLKSNWTWRLTPGQLTPKLAAKLKQVTIQSNRC